MSAAHAFIGRMHEGSLIGIYCHWHGQPDHAGFLLARHYRTAERVDELLNLGDISCLGKGPSLEEGTEAYTRDLGEEFLAPSMQSPGLLAKAYKHIYAWDGERWRYRKQGSDTWIVLTDGN